MKLLWELVLKDLRLFASDRKAMLIAFAVPIVIASFMASLMGGTGEKGGPAQKISVLVVDEDGSALTAAILTKLKESTSVEARSTTLDEAKREVDGGRIPLAVVIPAGFSTRTANAFTGGEKAELQTLTDPAKKMEAQIAKGAVTQAMMGELAKASFGGGAIPDSAFSSPYVERELAKPAAVAKGEAWSTMAHTFAGMAVQGLLFWAIDAAMGLMRERRQGIWRRLRAAPVAPSALLLGKTLSGAIVCLLILGTVFGFGALVFGFRINGSTLGFGLVAVAAAFMASTFGLFVAALGKTEGQSRGLSILAVLAMSMLGGAWFPSFMMPAWVQKISLAIPVRWAVDGFDAMTWRAHDLAAALPFATALFGFALLFGGVAFRRMSWNFEA